MAGEIDQIARGGEDLLGALRHVEAGVGERDLARPPLDQLGADLALQLAHLHRQRRLGDGAILRRPPEMPVARERGQITQLSQGDHVDKIFLSIGQAIRLDLMAGGPYKRRKRAPRFIILAPLFRRAVSVEDTTHGRKD